MQTSGGICAGDGVTWWTKETLGAYAASGVSRLFIGEPFADFIQGQAAVTAAAGNNTVVLANDHVAIPTATSQLDKGTTDFVQSAPKILYVTHTTHLQI